MRTSLLVLTGVSVAMTAAVLVWDDARQDELVEAIDRSAGTASRRPASPEPSEPPRAPPAGGATGTTSEPLAAASGAGSAAPQPGVDPLPILAGEAIVAWRPREAPGRVIDVFALVPPPRPVVAAPPPAAPPPPKAPFVLVGRMVDGNEVTALVREGERMQSLRVGQRSGEFVVEAIQEQAVVLLHEATGQRVRAGYPAPRGAQAASPAQDGALAAPAPDAARSQD